MAWSGVESICSTVSSDWVTGDKVQLTDRTLLALEERPIVSRMVDTFQGRLHEGPVQEVQGSGKLWAWVGTGHHPAVVPDKRQSCIVLLSTPGEAGWVVNQDWKMGRCKVH